MGATNRQKLEVRLWWSKTGFVDLSGLSDARLKRASEFWKNTARTKYLAKIKRTQDHIKRLPPGQDVRVLIAKNWNRASLVRMYDEIFSNELTKRKL